MAKSTRIIAVALQKGGVGKTTTAQHLAHILAMRGRKVLLMDLDPQGSLTSRYHHNWTNTLADVVDGDEQLGLMDVIVPTHEENLWLAPGGAGLKDADTYLDREKTGSYFFDRMLNDAEVPFDYVVMDTPPGKSALLIAALVAADEIIVPVQLSPMGFEGFSAIDETIAQARDLQSLRGEVRLSYRAVVPTFYTSGQIVSDEFLKELEKSDHPDYTETQLPVSTPIVFTTRFEQASARRQVGEHYRALAIWEVSKEEIVERAARAYADLALSVDSGGVRG